LRMKPAMPPRRCWCSGVTTVAAEESGTSGGSPDHV
jgi:hypothetical protein